MATYAVYHVFSLQEHPSGQIALKYIPRLFVTEAPAGLGEDKVQSILALAGYKFRFVFSEIGVPWIDLAWIDLAISRLKEAPYEIIRAARDGSVKTVKWEDLEAPLDWDVIDPD